MSEKKKEELSHDRKGDRSTGGHAKFSVGDG
jgi:hypothetical protein